MIPKSKENYLEAIRDIKRDLLDNTQPNGHATVLMLGLLVEAIVDLKEAIEPVYKENNDEPR